MATQGSKPWDGNNLIVEVGDFDQVLRDASAAKYLRPYRQATEMLYDKDRWCLWLNNADPSELKTSPVLRERLAAVREARLSSPTAPVRELADTPSRFAQDRQPTTTYVALPEVSSSNRDYIPGRYYDADTIAGNKLILFPDCPAWLFGYLQSRPFTAWVKTFAGRLKSDISISPGLTYFTFPFIQPEGKDLQAIEAAVQGVLDARAAHPNSCLADLYDPLAMPKDLRDAHKALDKAVLGLYGLKPDATESEILAALIARYKELDSACRLPLPTSGTAKVSPRAGKSLSRAATIRAWAIQNGFAITPRGRIPSDVIDAFDQAQETGNS